jgi:hypothetical protein
VIAGRSCLCRRRPSRANEEERVFMHFPSTSTSTVTLQTRESVQHYSEGTDAMKSPRRISIPCERSHSLTEESRERDSEGKVAPSSSYCKTFPALGPVFAHEPDGSSMDNEPNIEEQGFASPQLQALRPRDCPRTMQGTPTGTSPTGTNQQ